MQELHNERMTALMWLYNKLQTSSNKEIIKHFNDWINEAKEMEKKQIKDAHENGQGVVHNPYAIWRISDKAEEYYKETYEKGGETIKS